MAANGYYLKNGHWTIAIDPDSELYYYINMADWEAAAGTTVTSVVSTAARGVEMLDDGAIVDGKLRVMVTGLNEMAGAVNSVRFRFQCANGEKDDATIYFEKVQR